MDEHEHGHLRGASNTGHKVLPEPHQSINQFIICIYLKSNHYENEELKRRSADQERELAEARRIIADFRRRVTELTSS